MPRVSSTPCAPSFRTPRFSIAAAGPVLSPGFVNAHEHPAYSYAFPDANLNPGYVHRDEWRLGIDGKVQLPPPPPHRFDPGNRRSTAILLAMELRPPDRRRDRHRGLGRRAGRHPQHQPPQAPRRPRDLRRGDGHGDFPVLVPGSRGPEGRMRGRPGPPVPARGRRQPGVHGLCSPCRRGQADELRGRGPRWRAT